MNKKSLNILRVILGNAFLIFGILTLTASQDVLDQYTLLYKRPLWLYYLTGAIEVVASICILIGIKMKRSILIMSSLLLGIVSLDSAIMHFLHQEYLYSIPSLLLLILAGIVFHGHRKMNNNN